MVHGSWFYFTRKSMGYRHMKEERFSWVYNKSLVWSVSTQNSFRSEKWSEYPTYHWPESVSSGCWLRPLHWHDVKTSYSLYRSLMTLSEGVRIFPYVVSMNEKRTPETVHALCVPSPFCGPLVHRPSDPLYLFFRLVFLISWVRNYSNDSVT